MCRLIVLCLKLEEAARVQAHRTYLGSFFAYYDMSAVAAYPHHVTVAGEYQSLLNVFEQATVTFLVMFFYLGYGTEAEGYFGKSLGLGLFGHARIHVGPFVVLSFGSFAEVVHGVGNFASVEQFVPELGVLLFVVGCFFKYGGDLFVAVFTCL